MSEELSEQRQLQAPDLGDEAVRRHLGPGSLRLFAGIMNAWKAPDEEAWKLLALPPGTSTKDLDPLALSQDALLRISCLVGIYHSLHIYWAGGLADRWVRLANASGMFGGRSPLEYMAGGGLDAMRDVRNLLDAWCAGY